MTDNSISPDIERLRQVLGAFYKTVDVMKSARNQKVSMPVWADDMKAVEDVMLFLENLRDAPDAAATPQEAIADRLVDWTYLHATEGQQWPSTKTKSMLIDRAMQGEPTQDHADGMKAVAPGGAAQAMPDETELELLAKRIAGAELNYRSSYQLNGTSHIETGRKWDKMRKAGDAIRQYFFDREEASSVSSTDREAGK